MKCPSALKIALMLVLVPSDSLALKVILVDRSPSGSGSGSHHSRHMTNANIAVELLTWYTIRDEFNLPPGYTLTNVEWGDENGDAEHIRTRLRLLAASGADDETVVAYVTDATEPAAVGGSCGASGVSSTSGPAAAAAAASDAARAATVGRNHVLPSIPPAAGGATINPVVASILAALQGGTAASSTLNATTFSLLNGPGLSTVSGAGTHVKGPLGYPPRSRGSKAPAAPAAPKPPPEQTYVLRERKNGKTVDDADPIQVR